MDRRRLCPLCHGKAWLEDLPCGRCNGLGIVPLEATPSSSALGPVIIVLAGILAIALVVFSTTCSLDVGGIEYDWPRATDIVWRLAYHRADPPPILDLVGPDRLDCDGGWGFWRPPPGPRECLDGLFVGEANRVLVARPYFSLRPSRSKLAHELWHADLFRSGISDQGHTHAGFKPGGAVDQANALLRGEGLSRRRPRRRYRSTGRPPGRPRRQLSAEARAELVRLARAGCGLREIARHLWSTRDRKGKRLVDEVLDHHVVARALEREGVTR